MYKQQKRYALFSRWCHRVTVLYDSLRFSNMNFDLKEWECSRRSALIDNDQITKKISLKIIQDITEIFHIAHMSIKRY